MVDVNIRVSKSWLGLQINSFGLLVLQLVLHDITININTNDILIAQYDFIDTTILSSYYSR